MPNGYSDWWGGLDPDKDASDPDWSSDIHNALVVTLRDKWDETPIGENDFRLGPYELLLPPDSISVDQAYGPIWMSAPTIRQPNTSKFASGKLLQSVVISFIFAHQGDERDLEQSDLLDFIVLFKGMPFCPVQNKLLNETYGIDALALFNIDLQSISGYPNSYRVTMSCQAFNWQIYCSGNDFASLVDYHKLITYLDRGRELYLSKSKQEPSYSGGGYYTAPTLGYNEFELKFMTSAPDALSFNTDAMTAGDSSEIIKEWLSRPESEGGLGIIFEEASAEETDWNKIKAIISSVGMIDDNWQLNGTTGIGGDWTYAKLNEFLAYINEVTDPEKIAAVASEIRAVSPNLDPSIVSQLALSTIAQGLFDELKAEIDKPGDDIHSDTPPYYDETKIVIEGIGLSKAATVMGISVSMSNLLASLPIQMAEGNAIQYMGSDDSFVKINLVLHGDDADSDLAKLIKAFRLNQAIVRATKSIVGTGFIGLDSPLTVLCGMKTFLPLSIKTATLEGYPHAYSVIINLVDFDLYQQDRERLKRLNMQDELANSWVGHPALRFMDQEDKFNLYPDLYLEQDASGYWEQPDMYFIATPIPMPSDIVSNQELAFNNVPQDSSVSFKFSNGDASLEVDGIKMPFLSDKIPEGNTQNAEDIDFGENLRLAYQDYCSYNNVLRGSMRRAFPTFFFALIDEPRQLLQYRTYTDFYSRRGISQIIVNRSWQPMEEVAMFEISDIYRRLSFNPDPHTDSAPGTAGWWQSTMYLDRQTFFRKIGADIPVESIELQPGMRVHLRMGYSNRLTDLKIVFNGSIVEINPSSDGRNLNVVAQGDGRELMGVINSSDDNGDTADISGLFYSEPRELIVRLLTMRSSIWRNALSLMSQGGWSPDPKNGIRHFGELLPYDPVLTDEEKLAAETTKQEFITRAQQGGIALAGGQGGWWDGNIVAGMGKALAGPEGEANLGNLESMNIEIAIDNYSLLEALAKSIEQLWHGWDQNIFSRNIYPGTDSGLLEGFQTAAVGVPDDSIMTGAGGGSLWDRIQYALGDTFDFLSRVDEPSFKAMTYMRTTWDIIQQCSDLVPNYITAVRPFMHRSTLYYGKPFWKYTSGVTPIVDGALSQEYKFQVEEDLEPVMARLGLYKVKVFIENKKATTEGMELNLPSGMATVGNTDPFNDTHGTGALADGDFLTNLMVRGTMSTLKAKDGRSMGQVVAEACQKYNVPWELAMAFMVFETQFFAPGNSINEGQNNPGGIKYEQYDTDASGNQIPDWKITKYGVTRGQDNFCVFNSVEDGIECLVELLGTKGTYSAGMALARQGNMSGALNLIGPGKYWQDPGPGYRGNTQEERSQDRVKQMLQYISQIQSQASRAGGVINDGVQDPRTGSTGMHDPEKPGVGPVTFGEASKDEYPNLYDKVQEWMTGGKFEDYLFNTPLGAIGALGNVINNQAPLLNKLFIEQRQDSRPDGVWTPFFEPNWGPYPIASLLTDKSWEGYTGPFAYERTQKEITQYFGDQIKQMMTTGPGVSLFGQFLATKCDPDETPDTYGFNKADIRDFGMVYILEAAKQGGVKIALDGVGEDGAAKWKVVGANGEPLAPDFWEKFQQVWFKDPEAQENLYQAGHTMGDFNDPITDFINSDDGLLANIGKILMASASIFGQLAEFAGSMVQFGIGMMATLYNFGEITRYMGDFSKVMADALYNSNYTWGNTPNNPFSREFGEPVLEVREPFSKFHKIDSMRDIIYNNISVSANEVYPVVTSVSKGKKAQTVYADKSIAPEWQRELVYENYLNFDILNFRDGIHAKRIGLAACARSIRTMYQGSVDILGDCRMEPWDIIYIADVCNNMWGTAQIKEVTHTISADMGYVTQVSVMPIVTVDDPAQWAVSTIVGDWFKRIWGGDYETSLSEMYYGTNEVDAMMNYWKETTGKRMEWDWYDTYIGAGLAVGIVLFAAAIFLSVASAGTIPAAVVGTMGMTGASTLLNPNAMASLIEFFDLQQDVWVSLLIKNGEPYQAGLTGATGIVVGRQKTVGLDMLDLFAKDRQILTSDELFKQMGLSDVDIKFWEQDMQMFRGRALADIMTQAFVRGVWNPPSTANGGAGYIVHEATVNTVIDGDTITVFWDGTNEKQTIRFSGIDAAETEKTNGITDPKINPEKNAKGILAWEWVNQHIKAGDKVKIYIHPDYPKETANGKWEPRWLGFIETSDGTILNTEILLVEGGLATIWGRSEN